MIAVTRRAALTLVAGFAGAPAAAQTRVAWRTLRPGLEHGQAQLGADIGDRALHIARIDPAHFHFTLLTGAATHSVRKTARAWALEHHCVATINAAMFAANGLPVGFAKANGQIVQGLRTNDRSFFVFDDGGAELLDLSCDAFEMEAHENALQGIRMISCEGRNVWRQQERRWSIAALAQDRSGRILFLHARSPMSVHDFIAALQALPLSLARAMYLEGGPEATLYVNAGGLELERVGSYETGFNENDSNGEAWPLPNVIGAIPRV